MKYASDYSHLLQNDEPRWDTARVSAFWGMSTKYVSTAAKDGRIPGAAKLGDEWRFNPAVIRAIEGPLPPPRNPKPRRERKRKPLKNPARPGRRGHPKPAATAPVPEGPKTVSEWADFWEAQESK